MSSIINYTSNPENSCPLLFEVVPPTLGDKEERFIKHCDYLSELFERIPVTALNLPEINNESNKSKKGKRRNPFRKRVSPRNYARKLSQKFDTDFVINRVIVNESGYNQEEWLLNTFHQYGLHNIVLVGGESSNIKYPGPTVTDGNKVCKRYLNHGKRFYSSEEVKSTDLTIGNICIPTRREKQLDEPFRMINKVKSGSDFFTTQIILEADYAESLLTDFSSLLSQNNLDPPMIFWSFTPIREQRDVDFLRWLGVYIPDHAEDTILSSPESEQKSIEWSLAIWEHLQEINNKLEVPIPLGINISVMGLRNFRSGIKLAEALEMIEA